MIHEISCMHIDDLNEKARQQVLEVVKTKSKSFQDNFKGYVEIRIVSDDIKDSESERK